MRPTGSFFQSMIDMINIRSMNLSALDLNRLVALDALRQHMTAVGREIDKQKRKAT